MQVPIVFSSQVAWTPEEAVTTILILELSFIQNLREGDEMELTSKITHKMFKVASIFSLVSAGQGDVLTLGNPSKERDTWKGNVRAMELRCSTLQKEIDALEKEVKAANSLQEVVEIHSSPFVLVARATNMDDSLKDTKK